MHIISVKWRTPDSSLVVASDSLERVVLVPLYLLFSRIWAKIGQRVAVHCKNFYQFEMSLPNSPIGVRRVRTDLKTSENVFVRSKCDQSPGANSPCLPKKYAFRLHSYFSKEPKQTIFISILIFHRI